MVRKDTFVRNNKEVFYLTLVVHYYYKHLTLKKNVKFVSIIEFFTKIISTFFENKGKNFDCFNFFFEIQNFEKKTKFSNNKFQKVEKKNYDLAFGQKTESD